MTTTLDARGVSAWTDAFIKAEAEAAERRAAHDALCDAPVVGTPASVGVGSDSYPAVVTRVVPFKSGPKKGKVRAILVAQVNFGREAVTRSCATGGYGHDFTIDVTHPSVTHREGRVYTRREKHGRVRWVREGGADYESVGLGEARDYRDPHF